MSVYFFDAPLVKSTVSYNRFVSLVNLLINDKKIDELNLNLTKRTSLNFIQYLSYLPIILQKFDRKISIIADKKTIYLMQQRTNSLDFGDYENKDISNGLIKNTKLVKSPDEVLDWVKKIADEAPVFMDARLQSIFVMYIGEIFNNGLEHSEADYVVGSKYSKRREKIYTFSIYDTGKGIPSNVRGFLKTNIPDCKAIKWALEAGHSTAKQSGIPRGAGFNLLHSFAENNNGEIRILSGSGLYIFNPKVGKKYHPLNEEMIGTLFEMDIVCDPNHRYILK